jgi:hypothetical protein
MSEKINIVISAQTNSAIKGLDKVTQATRRTGNSVVAAQKRLKSFSGETTRATLMTRKFAMGGLQQAGYQIGDYAVQVANGTSKMQAFGQQAPQLLQIFGPLGAVAGAAVAIFAAFGVALQKSGKEVQNLGSALGVLQEPLSSIVDSVKGLRDIFGNVMPFIAQNIDTALIAAGLFAGYMATKFIYSMVAAKVSVLALNTSFSSLVLSFGRITKSVGAASKASSAFSVVMYGLGRSVAVVKKLLMRFAPVALLVGVAKLVQMFLQLKKGAGGFGIALGLLSDVVVEFFSNFGLRIQKLSNTWTAFAGGIKIRFFQAILYISRQFDTFVDSAIAKWNSTIGSKAEALKLNVGFNISDQLREGIRDVTAEVDAANAKISEIDNSIDGASPALAKLVAAFKAGKTEVDIFGDSVSNAAEKGANAVKKNMLPAVSRTKSLMESVSSSMENGFMSMVDGTKSVKDAFKSMAYEIIKELYRIFVVKRIVGMVTDTWSGLGSVGAPTMTPAAAPSLDGGGYTGSGARSGGLDGKGGFMAMLHPRETVIDHTKGQGSGGVVVNQTINVSTGVQQTVRTEIRTLMPQIAAASKAAVMDAKRRGGSYGKAMA